MINRPNYRDDAFTCPNCGIYARQDWLTVRTNEWGNTRVQGLCVCRCQHCKKLSLWYDREMVFPSFGCVPYPAKDLSDGIKHLYNEARSVVNQSPRCSTAL